MTTDGEGQAVVRRRILDRPVLPSTRAIVGGLLLAVSGIGTFVAWQQASGVPRQSYVVTKRAILPGQPVDADAVRLAPLELPGGVAGSAFADLELVVGRVALGPIGPDELVQAGQLTQAALARPEVQVALALPRDRAVDGQLGGGDRVDLFVTYPDHTSLVAAGVQVLSVSDALGQSLASGSDVVVLLALDASAGHAELIHAARAGEVTLIRSTQAGDASPPAEQVFRPGGAPEGGT